MFSSIKKINCTEERKISKKLMQLSYTHTQSWSLIRYHHRRIHEGLWPLQVWLWIEIFIFQKIKNKGLGPPQLISEFALRYHMGIFYEHDIGPLFCSDSKEYIPLGVEILRVLLKYR